MATTNSFTNLEPHQIYLTLCNVIEKGTSEEIDKVFIEAYEAGHHAKVAELYPIPKLTPANTTIENFMPPGTPITEEAQRKLAFNYPLWYTLMINDRNPEIRRVAVMRVPPKGTPISPLLQFAVFDESGIVRRAANEKLGNTTIREGRGNNYRSPKKSVRYVRSKVSTIDPYSPEIGAYVVDFRPSIRRLAALRLPPDSTHWEALAQDVSQRVRAVAAARADLKYILHLEDDPSPVIQRTIFRRKKDSIDNLTPAAVAAVPSAEPVERAEPDPGAVDAVLKNI